MNDNKDWLVALTGLAFLVIAIISFAVGGEPPNPSEDSVQELLDFYGDDESAIKISSALATLAGGLLVFFGGYLRKVLRAAEGEGHMLSAVALAGTVIIAIAIAIDATINFALAESVDDVDPAAVQALSALWSNDFLPFVLGAFVLLLSAGISIVRHGALPKWLGWVAIVLGVISLTPAGFIGFIGFALWTAIISVMLALRARSASAQA
jgi:hypothetical protein